MAYVQCSVGFLCMAEDADFSLSFRLPFILSFFITFYVNCESFSSLTKICFFENRPGGRNSILWWRFGGKLLVIGCFNCFKSNFEKYSIGKFSFFPTESTKRFSWLLSHSNLGREGKQRVHKFSSVRETIKRFSFPFEKFFPFVCAVKMAEDVKMQNLMNFWADISLKLFSCSP